VICDAEIELGDFKTAEDLKVEAGKWLQSGAKRARAELQKAYFIHTARFASKR